MAALAFDPSLPLARPAPRRALWLGQCRAWGQAQLSRLREGLRRGVGPRARYVLVVEADALLAEPGLELDLIEELVRSGCRELLVDFETLGSSEGDRREQLEALVQTLFIRGLRVHASFTLGLDHDDAKCFEELVAWVEARSFVSVELRLWTPEPGTSLVRRLAQADRVRHRDFGHWDGDHVVIRPAQMDAQTLYRGWCWAQRRVSSLSSAWRRRPQRLAELPAHLLHALAPARAGCRLRQRMLPPSAI